LQSAIQKLAIFICPHLQGDLLMMLAISANDKQWGKSEKKLRQVSDHAHPATWLQCWPFAAGMAAWACMKVEDSAEASCCLTTYRAASILHMSNS